MPIAKKKNPTWNDLKRAIGGLGRDALLTVLHDLYAASKDNRTFLHARFSLGDDVLEPYKAIIFRWICPDVMQAYSVAKAKKAISDYKKAIGDAAGLAELSVFYCESCRDLLSYCGMEDEGYFNALVRMFEQALKTIATCEPGQQKGFVARLEDVRREGHNWGWGIGGDMDRLMAEYEFSEK